MKRLKIWWMGFLLALCIAPSAAFAHANLLTMTPHNGQVVPASPEEIALEFSEPLEPDLIDLKMYDWNARPIQLDGPKLTPGKASRMYAKLPRLEEGTYTVVWSVVSEDGHPVNGSYAFSVGSVSPGETAPIGENSLDQKKFLLIALRYLVEASILLASGLAWLAWFGKRFGLPSFAQLAGRGWRLGWLLLVGGLIGEWFVYSATLPGGGLTSQLLAGKWKLLGQSPFAGMVLAQLVLLCLLAIPRMVEGWYLFIWLLLAGSLAFGGHAWGIEPLWLAFLLRIVHLLTIAIWLGGLGCLLLALRWEWTSGQPIDRAAFRPFFARVASFAAGAILLTGVGMAAIQTDWTSLVQRGGAWGNLLLVKIGLIASMLLLALNQTRRWKRDGRTLSQSLLRWETAAGMLALLAGVWMSQIAYPLPVKSYSETLQADRLQAVVQISQLQLGWQTMTIRLPDTAAGMEPKQVQVELNMTEMDMGLEPIPARKLDKGSYQADLPFTMSGKWTFVIDAEYPDGRHIRWTDTVFIPGGGE